MNYIDSAQNYDNNFTPASFFVLKNKNNQPHPEYLSEKLRKKLTYPHI